MASWDMGYQADIQYIVCYVRDMSPVYLNYVVTSQGFDFPQVDGNFKSCELGFGQGLSIALHSISAPGYWFGNDFNPSQVGFAQSLVDSAGLTQDNVLLVDDSFEELLKRDDLPKFDFIGLHGIWSWVSPENQQFIVEFIKKNLKQGGFVYISYNCPPGYTHIKPLRDLMDSLDKFLNSSEANPEERLKKVGHYISELMDLEPKYYGLVHSILGGVNRVLKDDYQYTYAEYFNQYWDLCNVETMFKTMAEANLSFVVQSNFLDSIESINLSPDQQQIFDRYRGTAFGEDLYDFLSDKRFRSDIYHHGARKLTAQERDSRVDAINIVLSVALCDVSLTITTRLDKLQLSPELYGPIYQLMSDFKVRSIGEIKAALKDKLSAAEVEKCINILLSQGTLDLARDPAQITAVERQQCLSYNNKIWDSDLNNIYYLASPITGGGLRASKVNMKLLAIFNDLIDHTAPKIKPLNGEFDIKQIASDLIVELNRIGHVLTKEDKELTNPEQALNYATTLVVKFKNYYLPYFKAMGVI